MTKSQRGLKRPDLKETKMRRRCNIACRVGGTTENIEE